MENQNKHVCDWKESPKIDWIALEEISEENVYFLSQGYYICAVCFRPIYFLKEEFNEYTRDILRGGQVVQRYVWYIHKDCAENAKETRESDMYVVTKNNPYYPAVEYFKTIDEATAQMKDWIEEMASEGGKYKCKVSVAQVIETITVRSDF